MPEPSSFISIEPSLYKVTKILEQRLLKTHQLNWQQFHIRDGEDP